jgi:hypothetical protein
MIQAGITHIQPTSTLLANLLAERLHFHWAYRGKQGGVPSQ